MRSIYPDLEFNREDPTLAGTLSVAIVDNSGREFYAINRSADLRILAHDTDTARFLREYVVPHLPIRFDTKNGTAYDFRWDLDDPEFVHLKSPDEIAADLTTWLELDTADGIRAYGYCGAGDLTRLHHLWRNDWTRMPKAMPRYATELKSLADALGVNLDNDFTQQPAAEAHHALADARNQRAIHQMLAARGGLAAMI